MVRVVCHQIRLVCTDLYSLLLPQRTTSGQHWRFLPYLYQKTGLCAPSSSKCEIHPHPFHFEFFSSYSFP